MIVRGVRTGVEKEWSTSGKERGRYAPCDAALATLS